MQWHTLRTFLADGWREYSTWGGVILTGGMAALFTADQIADWTARLAAAGVFSAGVLLLLKRDR